MVNEIYYIKWFPSGVVLSTAYDNLTHASIKLQYLNENLTWRQRLSGGKWVMGTLFVTSTKENTND